MHNFISFLLFHPREHNERFEPSFVQRLPHSDRKVLGVYEYECLSALARNKYFLDEVKLLLLINFVNVLLDAVDPKHGVLRAHFYLDALAHEFVDYLIDRGVFSFDWEGGREQYPLDRLFRFSQLLAVFQFP